MELLVRVVHRGDPAHPQIGESYAGDVIAACPDGWGWTEIELRNPEWRIFRVPLTPTEVEALTTIERIPPTAPRGTIGHRRRFAFDVTALPCAFVADDRRAVPILSVDAEVLRAAVIQRASS